MRDFAPPGPFGLTCRLKEGRHGDGKQRRAACPALHNRRPTRSGRQYQKPALPFRGGGTAPLYSASGQGPHLYLYIEREGWTTRRLQQELARVFGLKDNQVGYAGLKDKNAQVRQSFSLQINALDPKEAARRVEEELGIRALSASRHQNKLKVGHLLGNRFRILLVEPGPGSEEAARRIAQALAERGPAQLLRAPSASGPEATTPSRAARLFWASLRARNG